jgi:Ca2+-binding EF-hand superfamily protein
LLW